jgi:hypothetical protein
MGEGGRGFGQFLELTDVAVDPNGYVYALDKANGYRVQRFEPFFVAAPPPKPTLIPPAVQLPTLSFPLIVGKLLPVLFAMRFVLMAARKRFSVPTLIAMPMHAGYRSLHLYLPARILGRCVQPIIMAFGRVV